MRKRAILVAGALVGVLLIGLIGTKVIENNKVENSLTNGVKSKNYRINNLIKEGLAKIEDNKFEEAIQIFDRVLQVDSNNKEAKELRQNAQNAVILLDSNNNEEYKMIKESFTH
ncbi:hypothetical protein BH721_10815 [Clostridium baratii]|uniref:hypothetical protein n=1 Tax=Clostridium baratii TaxID=1561 RepID=UPI0009A2C7EF|nr:hypothetical protein [Clostridium baratii]OPF51954.1 hypothetical protein A1M12_05325 [Clostridium baratii]OPF53599.1 hypothetical protein BH721_10815 [Clostridium baratii]OPF56468.1 hypothetical protein BH724_11720 [Clostridium baratii]OPF60646.1 hypothetical protein BH725_08780 [Clostridium baratii]